VLKWGVAFVATPIARRFFPLRKSGLDIVFHSPWITLLQSMDQTSLQIWPPCKNFSGYHIEVRKPALHIDHSVRFKEYGFNVRHAETYSKIYMKMEFCSTLGEDKWHKLLEGQAVKALRTT
jgi:hypothetical protein